MKKIFMVIGAAVASMAVAANAWTVPDETLRYSVNFNGDLSTPMPE